MQKHIGAYRRRYLVLGRQAKACCFQKVGLRVKGFQVCVFVVRFSGFLQLVWTRRSRKLCSKVAILDCLWSQVLFSGFKLQQVLLSGWKAQCAYTRCDYRKLESCRQQRIRTPHPKTPRLLTRHPKNLNPTLPLTGPYATLCK